MVVVMAMVPAMAVPLVHQGPRIGLGLDVSRPSGTVKAAGLVGQSKLGEAECLCFGLQTSMA